MNGEVKFFVKIQKKKMGGGWVGGVGGGGRDRGECQGGCERRIKVIVIFFGGRVGSGGGGGGVRVDVNGEVEFL